MSKQNKAYFFAIITVLCWSTVGTAFKIALKFVNYVQLLFWAVFVSLIVFTVILFLKKMFLDLFKQSKKDILKSAIIGFINPFLYYLILFRAYDLLLAQEALSINYMWPIVLVILSVPILKQKLSIKSFLAILISFFGTYIIATKGKIFDFQFSNTVGVVLALLSTFIWSVFWLFNLKDKRNEIIKLFMVFFFGFLYILLYSLITNNFQIPVKNGIFAVSYVGVFEMGLTFFLWMLALSLSETTAKVSNFIYFTPFLSLVIVNFVLKENIQISTILGVILIVFGIILQNMQVSRKL